MQNDVVFNFRMDKSLAQRIDEVCGLRREKKATFLRRIILKELGQLGFLDENEQRAFGINASEVSS